MKIKRAHLTILLTACLILSIFFIYIFRPMTMDDVYKKPNFRGTVREVRDNSIVVLIDENEDEFKSSDKIVVSLDVKLKDSMTDFDIGDKVAVYYDGTILETYPAQVKEVYAITLQDRSKEK